MRPWDDGVEDREAAEKAAANAAAFRENVAKWVQQIEVGRTPPRYPWWRHVLGWAFVLSVLGIGVWGLWGGLLWVVARLGAAWRGGG